MGRNSKTKVGLEVHVIKIVRYKTLMAGMREGGCKQIALLFELTSSPLCRRHRQTKKCFRGFNKLMYFAGLLQSPAKRAEKQLRVISPHRDKGE